MNKKIISIIVIVIVIVVVAVVFLLQKEPVSAPSGIIPETPPVSETPTVDDTTVQINQELQGIDLGDLDQEFQAIDADLNQL